MDSYSETMESVTRICKGVVRAHARAVDGENRFPSEAVDELRKCGLIGFMVPRELGGHGGDIRTLSQIAQALGEECLSTAIIWVMHCQQIATIASSNSDHAEILSEVATTGALVASVTTEEATGGDLLRAQCSMERTEESFRVRREAPIVSFGEEASCYLVKMRSGPDRPNNDVSLVLVKRGDGDIRVTGEWNAMGMRGTRSVPMSFDVAVSPDRILGTSFRSLALQVFVPYGHIGWSAAWLGAARGAYRRLLAYNRKYASRPPTDLFVQRVAELRLSLDMHEAILDKTILNYTKLSARSAGIEEYEDATYNIGLNNLKIAGSRLSFSVVDGLVELAGLGGGYLSESELGVERVFRDLRSAQLMFGNDRLLGANGKLALLEKWRPMLQPS